MTDWICDTVGLWCADHGEYVTHVAPEISGTALLLGVALCIGLLALVMDHERGGKA